MNSCFKIQTSTVTGDGRRLAVSYKQYKWVTVTGAVLSEDLIIQESQKPTYSVRMLGHGCLQKLQ